MKQVKPYSVQSRDDILYLKRGKRYKPFCSINEPHRYGMPFGTYVVVHKPHVTTTLSVDVDDMNTQALALVALLKTVEQRLMETVLKNLSHTSQTVHASAEQKVQLEQLWVTYINNYQQVLGRPIEVYPQWSLHDLVREMTKQLLYIADVGKQLNEVTQ